MDGMTTVQTEMVAEADTSDTTDLAFDEAEAEFDVLQGSRLKPLVPMKARREGRRHAGRAGDAPPLAAQAETGRTPAGNIDPEQAGRGADPLDFYFAELKADLLTREDEVAIAKRIEAGREEDDWRPLRERLCHKGDQRMVLCGR